MAQLVTNPPARQETLVQSLDRRDRLPTPVFLSFPCGSAGKESTCNAGDLGSIPGLGRSLGKGKGYPLQYSGLEKSMDCIVHGVTKSRTRLSEFNFQGESQGLSPGAHQYLGVKEMRQIKPEIMTEQLERQDQKQACTVPWKLKEESGSGGNANCWLTYWKIR